MAPFTQGHPLSLDDSGSQNEEAIDFKATFVTIKWNLVILTHSRS